MTRLAADRGEIERLANEAIARVDPAEPVDLPRTYLDGIEQAVGAVFDHILGALVAGSAAAQPVPLAALDQARRAAKAGVARDTVLRRYMAGDRALRRVLDRESAGFAPSVIDDVHHLMDEVVDIVMRSAAAEFDAEAARLSMTSDPALVTTLALLNEEIHVAEVDSYVLDRWHVGLVTGSDASRAYLLRVARSLGAQSLVVDSRLGQRWVWIGKNEPLTATDVERALIGIFEDHVSFALGEPRRGLPGWRLTHTEARGAARLPGAEDRSVTRMRGRVLEAAVLENDAFVASLMATYIEPLEEDSARPAGDLRQTVRAYLRSGQNAKSAADLLGIDRHTVLRRVRKVEELVGERVEDCSAHLETALRIATVDDPRPGG
ncbi:MAG: helix-turn-helix domain-containing protein [Solirubrobacterales bacterium]